MARKFIEYGHTKANNKVYQKLDTEITQMALAAAKKVARRNFGYTRNDEMIHHGRMVILYKLICKCKVDIHPSATCPGPGSTPCPIRVRM